ncbi:MAG: sigma-70 family RNA polymerase sigma factor [Propionibacteriales bacterium]|jgi:RNA polymerase sigma-70 factor (sigma-E family)|nr:sigma-70 family RNA polymerase sigma factor [Propionibacteriales bacterium]
MGDFEAYARASSSRLLRLAVLLTDRQQDAEDLAQDALLHIQTRWATVSAAENMDAYARRVLINYHLSKIRKKDLQTIRYFEDGLEISQPDHADLVTQRHLVRRALQRLPTRQRTAVVLRYYEQLETQAISALMDISESSVRSAISRGTDSLRGLLWASNEGNNDRHAAVRD